MSNTSNPTPIPAHAADSHVEYDTAGAGLLSLGQWVLVLPEAAKDAAAEQDMEILDGEEGEEKELSAYHDDKSVWLGCVTKIGSNYAEITHPPRPGYGNSCIRVHFSDVWRRLKLLTPAEAESMLQHKIQNWQQESGRVMGSIQSVARSLGLATVAALPSAPTSAGGTALATMASQKDIGAYQTALVVAKDKTLPALYKELEGAHGELARWLGARAIAITAVAGDMKAYVNEISDRIFSLSLYAGLVEEAVKIQDGKPAAMPEKLMVFQLRLFMEEECLAGYRAGGISFHSIGEFDQWLLEPENLNRILPNPRCMVAFRVRRKDWNANLDGILHEFIRISLQNEDRKTFLYVRNGDQVWRIDTELDFGDMLFPDKAVYDPSEPLMMKREFKIVFMKRSEYEDRLAEHLRKQEEQKAWLAANPQKKWEAENPGLSWDYHQPYSWHSSRFDADAWSPVDPSNVYFDEAMQALGDEVKRYNRLAVVIQGLFDRSEILHPHAQVSAWTPEGFASAIQLVYDGAMVLNDGEMPDFDSYMRECNASLGVGSVVFGQHHAWQRAEAVKEKRRREADWRLSSNERHREILFFKPYGNPGPKRITTVDEWKPRSRMAKFNWSRQRLTDTYYGSNEIACSISVPDTQLFNISAYTPGDYKKFFTDHRSRARYKEWAPALLAAEDYWGEKE